MFGLWAGRAEVLGIERGAACAGAKATSIRIGHSRPKDTCASTIDYVKSAERSVQRSNEQIAKKL